MHCRTCLKPVDFGPFRTEGLRRFRQFTALALAIAFAGLVLQLFEVAFWPLTLYGISAFVWLQAILKWQDSRWVICGACGDGYTHYRDRRP